MQELKQSSLSELTNDRNRRVLAYIADKSAHSDLSEVLRAAVQPLAGVQVYSPDWPKYQYVVASTEHVIFAFAIGENTIAFRLNRTYAECALATGATPFPPCGENWVTFMPFRADWPRVDFQFWAMKAYECARNPTAGSGAPFPSGSPTSVTSEGLASNP